MSFFLVYSIVLMAGVFVLLGLVLFAEYRKLDELESYFSENEKVRRHKRFWGRNQPIDRFHRMGLMIDFLSMPKTHIKAGLVTEAELASVPIALRRWALWPYRMTYVWIVACIICEIWFRW
ncbi:hypothetical protein [Pseudomonas sp. Marseille-Q1929]|uniref:hypothetical protein n=1 Tax=Pseudomonas sp. Marseille-Q1929 TaxID=2730402 RepID=UPI001A8D265C|nr:hypothetical protein [Pseudomonas sp. Marseille-Q1929]MBO0494296.1 hypothetical protein [Pseudomonas sp. Marseille-Q1929]